MSPEPLFLTTRPASEPFKASPKAATVEQWVKFLS